MKNRKTKAVACLSIGLSLFAYSFSAQGWNRPSLVALGVVFVVAATVLFLSLYCTWRWLTRAAQVVGSVRVTDVSLFLMLLAFGLGLIRAKYVLPGLLVILIAYGTYGSAIGQHLGRTLRSILKGRAA
jgi:hypothetical protein